jgi:hypothetical protein
MPTDLESYEFNTHVFVVKIWLEELQSEHKGIWRGYITHVTSGERRYINGFLDVVSFIIPYLIKMRAKINWFWRFGEFIRRKKKRNNLNDSEQLSKENDYRAPL